MNNNLKETNIHGNSMFPLQVYSHTDKNGFYAVSPHWHTELEFIYIEKGEMQGIISGKKYLMKANEFYFVNSGQLHELTSNQHSLNHAIVFDASMLNFEIYDTCQHNLIQPITNNKLLFPVNITPLLSDDNLKVLKDCFYQIIHEYKSHDICRTLTIKICLFKIFELLLKNNILIKNIETDKQKSNINELKSIIYYIKRNYSQKISLSTLANIACMNESYFCRYFRKQTRKTPITFINEYRIHQASRMIANTKTSISLIASDCGFDNFSYFTRTFRKCKGISPKEYRNNYKIMNINKK